MLPPFSPINGIVLYKSEQTRNTTQGEQKMSRFTVKDLCEAVEEYNRRMLEEGARIQFHVAGRNGYQAVDEYKTDGKGKWLSTRCLNVGCGTSREVNEYCNTRFYQIINAL